MRRIVSQWAGVAKGQAKLASMLRRIKITKDFLVFRTSLSSNV
ncbi:MAG TPA: hypothetical protein VFO27_11405 [Bryobacteraceae bacterium]|nr:hypothetical protein [Bryobacteraceae bacterium]